MKILVLGERSSFSVLETENRNNAWQIHFARSEEEVLDFSMGHCFQAVLINLDGCGRTQLAVMEAARRNLSAPVFIGVVKLANFEAVDERVSSLVDVVLIDNDNAHKLKLQLESLMRFALGLQPKTISASGLIYDTKRRRFTAGGRTLDLQRRQNQILELLFWNAGNVVANETFLSHIYGWDEPPNDRVVDVFVCNIRKKLKEYGVADGCIQTRWGQGYYVELDQDNNGTIAA